MILFGKEYSISSLSNCGNSFSSRNTAILMLCFHLCNKYGIRFILSSLVLNMREVINDICVATVTPSYPTSCLSTLHSILSKLQFCL